MPDPTISLLGDIGGTNARFALSTAPGRLSAVERILVADYPSPESAIRHFLERQGCQPEVAILAVAAAVDEGKAQLTNAAWRFDAEALAAALGMRRIVLLNDFAAVALAVPRLGAGQVIPLGGGPGRSSAPSVVLGPGTGLGCATLLPDSRVLVGEGGHVTLPAVDEREAALLSILRRRFGHVSAERVVSGPGLVALCAAIAELDGLAAPSLADGAEVVAAAKAGGPAAQGALDAFFGFLGTVAGNMALMVGAHGGFYLGGGILPQLRAELCRSCFSERFQAKGRFRAYLAQVPLKLIVEPDPAILGLAHAAELLRDRAGERQET